MNTPTFDVHEIPFSRRGSWLNVSPVIALHTISPDLHLVSHTTGMHAVLSLVPLANGEKASTTIASNPATLTWSGASGQIEVVFETLDTVRVRGKGLSLRVADAAPKLTPFTGTFFFRDPIDDSAIFTSYETGRRYRVTSLSGALEFEGAEALGASARAVVATGDEWEIVIEEFETARPPFETRQSFDDAVAVVNGEFSDYLEAVAGWRTETTPAAELAAYVLWSATVAPAGFMKRESILMSKHWMDKLWSWDHCFNALALAPSNIDLALDQFLAPFDYQEASGALPDSITHSEILYNFVKPPIHGWALAKIRARAHEPINHDKLEQIYAVLAKWSLFWLNSRRVPGHGLPHYQHGNDSGWDNSTAFDFDRLIESPDLAAFLLIQLDVVASLADEIGNGKGDEWRARRDEILAALMSELWIDKKFTGVGVLSGTRSKTTSLLTLLPIVAGKHFPIDVVYALAADIDAHVTEWGPATQLPGTVEYEDDGYWRGPIWAPSTVLIEDGLRTSGHVDLADTVSARFRRLCETSGFAENFDALTGEGLRDRAYTWTASSYLLLAHEAIMRAR